MGLGLGSFGVLMVMRRERSMSLSQTLGCYREHGGISRSYTPAARFTSLSPHLLGDLKKNRNYI